MFVYHRRSSRFVGVTIHPLNILRNLEPEIAAQEIKKYEGREQLLEARVPPLDCLWNDVIHCSPVHPKLILGAMCEVGFEIQTLRYFEIPVERLAAAQTIIFCSRIGQREHSSDQYLEFTETNLDACQELPDATRAYYQSCWKQGHSPLTFAGVPHVLFRGSLDTSKIKTFEV
jgi:hypothetical protein